MRTRYVASGEYALTGEEKERLKALLGSCVGVVVIDRERGLGGLAHFLLPAPAGGDPSWNPQSFAATGLPLFLDAVIQAGGRPEHLEAVVAGGALFGEISRRDVNLDIGGRTIDEVHAVLAARSIPIVREESGGFDPCALSLEAPALEVVIDNCPGQAGLSVSTPPPLPPSTEAIDEAVASVNPVPQAALKVMRLVSDEYDMSEVAAAIMADQVLGGRVLSLCNSPLYGARRHIDSLDQALMILGESRLVEMVAAAAVEGFMEQHRGGYSLLRGGLYRHALATAHMAKALAAAGGRVEPGAAYTAGLLHDIGKVVLDQFFAASLPEFYRQARPGQGDSTGHERRCIGVDHQEAGRRLAVNWHLPDNLAAAVGGHHRPDTAPDEYRPLVSAVYAADLLATWFLAGMEHERISDHLLAAALEEIGLAETAIASLLTQVPWTRLMYA